MAKLLLTKEQIEEIVDRVYSKEVHPKLGMTLEQAAKTGYVAIYFGITGRTSDLEWDRFMTARGNNGGGNNMPVLQLLVPRTYTYGGKTKVGRCKLDPGLKATCFQPLNLRVHTVLST